jgi:hypothetical protein
MARFRYLGELPREYVVAYGPTTEFRLPRILLPVSPATEFVVGVDIGHDITDQFELIKMRADTRFAEIA